MIAIKPVSDLRNYNEVLQDVADESPVFLTKNGRGCYAVISIRDYEKLTATKTLFSELKKGEESALQNGWLDTTQVRKMAGLWKIAPQAAADLLEIKNYLENELQNPIAAHNTISKIIETYENLTFSPNGGISVEKYVSFPTDYKFVLANNYSIFYRIEDEVIRIVRILYSRRDFIRVLFGEKSK